MEKAAKQIILKTKGFEGKDNAGLAVLVKTAENFINTGELQWSFADYMGYAGSGKGSSKHADVVRQLSEAPEAENAVKLLNLFPQIEMRFADKTQPISFKGNSVSLRNYFQPLLKARGEEVVEKEVDEKEVDVVDGEVY